MQQFDILIAGGGYAGVMCALRLAGRLRGRQSIALVNPRLKFLERPRLHETLIEQRHPPRAIDLASFLASRNVVFIQGAITGIDRENWTATIEQPSRKIVELAYDRLVLACGTTVSRASCPGLAEYGFVLEAGACNGPERLRIALAQTRNPRVLIVGAGATGVEAAAEIAIRGDAKILLADNGIFGGFTTSPVAKRLRTHLARIGVDLRENCAIQSVAASQAKTSKGPIDFDICINTTGFTGTSLAMGTGLETTPGGRILTDPFLRALGDNRIYAVGDAGQPQYGCGAPPRMSVFFALATGAHAAEAIADELAGRRKRPFGFWTYGQAFGLGHAALGFGNLPHDRAFPPYYMGRTGYYLRHFFVWLLLVILKIERRRPGLPFYLGRPWRRRPDNWVPTE